MSLFLGIILFWVSTFGYLLFFKKKTKLPYEILLPIIFSLIGICMFLAGILNIMKETTLLVYLIGIIFFIYKIIKKQFNFKDLLNVNFIIYFIVFLSMTIICSKARLLQYDNFSHWAVIIKNMYANNRLPNFENITIMFKTYQPGSACFIYYLGALSGKSEQTMIIGQNYMIIASLFSLFAFTDKKAKHKKNYILKISLISFYLYTLFGNIVFNELPVDTLIAAISISSFAVLYYFKNNLKKAFIYNLPIIIFIFLIKNIGIVLVGISCLGLIYLGFRNKQIKKGFIYAILTGVISVAFFYIWTKHVSLVYGTSSLTSKHSLTFDNILSELSNKGWTNIILFCKIYVKKFLNIANNLPNQYMIHLNAILILMISSFNNGRKHFTICLIMSNMIYFIYYGILGIMYLLSMPWEEAIILASFDRYMLTIIFIIIGLILLFFYNFFIKEKKIEKKHIAIPLIISVLFIVITFKYKINNYIQVTKELDLPYKFDQALGTTNYNVKNDEWLYIFADISIQKDSGYVGFLTEYKLNSRNYDFVFDTKDFNPIKEETHNVKIINLNKNKKIDKFLKENGYKLVNGFYQK